MVICTTLWLFNIAIENGPFIGGLPIKKMVIFHGYVSLPEGNQQNKPYFFGCLRFVMDILW